MEIEPKPKPAPAPEEAYSELYQDGLDSEEAPSEPTTSADATLFSPRTLARSEPCQIQVYVHKPSERKGLKRIAREHDSTSRGAPSSRLGDFAHGSRIEVKLSVYGGAVLEDDVEKQWTGDTLRFGFLVQCDEAVKTVAMVAHVLIDGARIGTVSVSRKVTGKKSKGNSAAARMRRSRRVFLSYANQDRDTVAIIAAAYERAGVPHFFDRTGIRGGALWAGVLFREIERADVFHLCWSEHASRSIWVEREADHALQRRKRSWRKVPEIAVQMLDGPPWAAHPASLDEINFDDFTRAAMAGYARALHP